MYIVTICINTAA